MKKKRSFLGGLRKLFGEGQYETVSLGPSDRLRLSGKSLRVPCPSTTYVVEMGKQTVHICPDRPLEPTGDTEPQDLILFDPKLYYSGISHALRLKPGETLSIDHRVPNQKLTFSKPKHAFRRHLQISHKGNTLDFKDPISELGTYLSVLDTETDEDPMMTRRNWRLNRIREIFGGPLKPMQREEAVELLSEVNRQLMNDPFRKEDSLGNAGSLVQLPVNLTPIVVGDLHGQVNNLLTILFENSFLESLDRSEAVMIILGDAVHGEEPGELEDMDSSVLIMDLILKLKRQYPAQVFFLLGNHDSFSPDVMKGGVAQSLLWEKRITELRGEEYARQLALFYRQSPLFVLSKNFLACHAGPPRTNISVETLVEARQFPELVHQLTWNRMKSKSWPVGYTKGDIKRLRKSLGVDEERPFIVAHYPQAANGSVWLNVGEIPNHHIIYSARKNEVGVFTRVKSEMVAQVFPSKNLVDVISEETDQAM